MFTKIWPLSIYIWYTPDAMSTELVSTVDLLNKEIIRLCGSLGPLSPFITLPGTLWQSYSHISQSPTPRRGRRRGKVTSMSYHTLTMWVLSQILVFKTWHQFYLNSWLMKALLFSNAIWCTNMRILYKTIWLMLAYMHICNSFFFQENSVHGKDAEFSVN